MNQKILNRVFIWGFLLLYLMVAFISFCHAVEFFSIGNVRWMSILLAFAFEVGLALSLTAILLSDDNKKNTVPWILMVVLCLVQVIGNVYSVFKYISLSDSGFYVYLQKSMLFWIQGISQETVQVIVSWIMGAILPIVALMMTEMVSNNIKHSGDRNVQERRETSPEVKETSHKHIFESSPVVVENKTENEADFGSTEQKAREDTGKVETDPGQQDTAAPAAVSIEEPEETKQEEPQAEEPDDKEVTEENTAHTAPDNAVSEIEDAVTMEDNIADYVDVLSRQRSATSNPVLQAEALRGRTNPDGTARKITPQYLKNFASRGTK